MSGLRWQRGTQGDPPPGYAPWSTDALRTLWLPQSLTDTLRQEVEARLNHERMQAREQLQEKAQAELQARTRAAEEELLRREAEVNARCEGPVSPGWHRVLPTAKAWILARGGFEGDETDALDARVTDSEVRARIVKVRQQLVEKGFDRPVAVPQDWADQVARLEEGFPNFRKPIELLRTSLALLGQGSMVRVPPMLLLGPPGVGKTYFSQRVAQMLGTSHGVIAFDQPTAGSTLLGLDKHWSNTQAGLLLELLVQGEWANPVVLLDEVDKASRTSASSPHPLSQLHTLLEPQTARRAKDVSLDLELDASLVGYIATANTLDGLRSPLLSRFEVFDIEPPNRQEASGIARQVVQDVLRRLGLQDRVRFEPRALQVLTYLSPRLMSRKAELLVGQAVQDGRQWVREDDALQAVVPVARGGLH